MLHCHYFCFSRNGDHRELHVLTHSFPTRRSSDLPEGDEGAGPVKVGVALTDILTGVYSTVAILAALAHRDHVGGGQHIDMALLDVQVACLANQAMNYLTTGNAPRRLGNAHPNIVPYQDFPRSEEHTSELQSLMRISYA